MPPQHICLHLFKTRFLHCRIQRWILPALAKYLQGCIPVIHRDTLCWNPPKARTRRGVITHVSVQNISTACTTALKTSPTPLDSPPPLPRLLTDVPRYSLPSAGYPQLPTNIHPKPSWSGPIIWRMSLIIVAFHRPRRPSLWSPSSPLPPGDDIYAPPHWNTRQWWCGGHSRTSKVPAYHNGGTMSGVGLPLPVLSWFPWCFCGRNSLLEPSS